ncbi:MAG: hypothetical protein EU540_05930 [Promethearchaeota archaeon]|nr:MAG: hypothetical protein EU540_05930 [Candidatus Lokiarchaeota archaeon]
MKLEDLKNLKVPTAMIKKLFPPKKSVFTVDTTGDGKADMIKIGALNLFAPFEIPAKEDLGDINVDEIDPSEHVKLFLNGDNIDISKGSPNVELIKKSLRIHHKGDSFSFDDLLDGKMGGRTIAMGDEITVMFKLDESLLAKLTEGKHTIGVESDKIPNIEIGFELNQKNMNQK